MDNRAFGVLILAGVALFLYSRRSQASYAPAGSVVVAPAGESWSPDSLIQTITQAVDELLTPLTQPSTTPVQTNEGTAQLPEMPAIENPIPPLPAM